MSILQKLVEAGKLTQEDAQLIEQEIAVKYTAELEKLKSEKEQLEKEVATTKEQLEKERQTLREQLEKAKKEGNIDKIKEYEEKLAEKEKQLNEMSQTVTELKVSQTLNSVLDKFDVIDKDIVAAAVRQQIKVDDNGNIVYGDGKPVEDGLKEFFEKKPHLLKSKGTGGSGSSNPTSFSGGVKRRSEMSDSEKAQFIKENGQEAYLNLPE